MPYMFLDCNRRMPEKGRHCVVKGKDSVIPACSTDTHPGDFTERGCPLLGCRVVICGQIKNVIHLVHSPVGCAYYSWDYRVDSEGYCLTTDMQEKDIVFGGETKLFDAVIMAVKEFDADAVFVYETCSTGIIGDDIQAVAKMASEVTGKPVIAFTCAGFRGISQNAGHKIANTKLFELVGTGELDECSDYTVNVIGDFNAKDTKSIERMLNRLGIHVVCSFTADATLDRIRAMHRAKLNLVHCSRSSIFMAEMMQEKFGTPYIEVNFFGIENCCESLRRTCEALGICGDEVEEVIEKYLSEITPEIEYYRERLEGKKVFICHGAQRAIYWIRPFEELGMKIAGIATFFGRKDDYEKIMESVDDGTVVIDNPDAEELEEVLLEVRPDIFISDDKVKPFVHKLGIPFVNGRGQGKTYAGFEGFVNFAGDVNAAINSKVWKLVRSA